MPLPLALIPIALRVAPSLINLITGSDKAEEITQKTVDVVSAVTGIDVGTPDGAQRAADALESDPALMADMTMRLRAIESDEVQALLADRRDGRNRDIEVRKLNNGRNTRADVMLAGAFIALIGCVAGSIWMAFSIGLDSVQVQLTFGLLNTISGFLMKILSDAFSFEFGSSRGSKEKSAQLDRLIPETGSIIPDEAVKAVSGAFRSLR